MWYIYISHCLSSIQITACFLQLPAAGPAELGATWFHGTEHNPVYDLAVEYGMVAWHIGKDTPHQQHKQQQQQQQEQPVRTG